MTIPPVNPPPRNAQGQMGVLVLIVVPALALLVAFAADASAIIAARGAADELATSLSRYAAADATQRACDPANPQCTGRNRQCAASASDSGGYYLDVRVVEEYNLDAGPAGEVAFAGRPAAAALVARLPANVTLQQVTARTVIGAANTATAVRVDVRVRRTGLLSEALLGTNRQSVLTASATSTTYVPDLGSGSLPPSPQQRTPVSGQCL